MTTHKEALKQLLEALDKELPHNMKHIAAGQRFNARTALAQPEQELCEYCKRGLKTMCLCGMKAQPEQEPVAYTNGTDVILAKHWTADYPPEGWKPLDYTTPPQRKPLTDEQIMKMWIDAGWPVPLTAFTKVIRAIEAAHGIKEKA